MTKMRTARRALRAPLAFIKRILPRVPSLSGRRSHVIEFATRLYPQEHHGTLTFNAGQARATWTVHSDGASSTADRPITDAEFRTLWNTARFLHRLQPFDITGSVQELDTSRNFLVSMASTEGTETVLSTYLIPHDCPDAKVAAWVERLWLIGEAST